MAAEIGPPPYAAGPRYDVIANLARFRFLTVAQLLRLRVAANKHQVYALLRGLEAAGLVKRRRNDRLRSEPDVFWITRAGAALVDPEHGELTDYPRQLNITGEIWHRLAIIDVHIALRVWADSAAWHVDWVKTDFTRSGSKGRKATTTPMPSGTPYVPDATALVTGPDQVARLLVFEVYWRGSAGLHHFKRQIETVHAAANAHAVEKFHGIENSAARYLVSFQDADTRCKATSALIEPTARTWRQFYFADHPALLDDFATAWHDAVGNRKPLFATA